MRHYSTVIGLFLLTLVIVLLCSSPQDLFCAVYFIDTELQGASENKVSVRVKVDLGKEEHLDELPLSIGQWQGSGQDAWWYEMVLNADVVLMRTYVKANESQPVYLLLMQSSSLYSLHAPPICYTALGYEIEDEGSEEVYVKDATWTIDFPSFPVAVKRLVVQKPLDDEGLRRRVVLYFYVKDRAFTSDKISMVRVSTPAAADGALNDSVDRAREFMSEVIPLMFEPHQEGQMYVEHLAGMGPGGYFAIAGMLAIPLVVMLYPYYGWKLKRRWTAGGGRGWFPRRHG